MKLNRESALSYFIGDLKMKMKTTMYGAKLSMIIVDGLKTNDRKLKIFMGELCKSLN